MLEAWAAAEPGTPDEGLTAKQEIKAIHEAMVGEDEEFLARYGGFAGAGGVCWTHERIAFPSSKCTTDSVATDGAQTTRL